MIETMPQTKQVEEFLISIGPFYEIVPEEKATTPERQAETSQSESMKKEGSESEDDDMFQDSLGDLPSHLVSVCLSSVSPSVNNFVSLFVRPFMQLRVSLIKRQ